MTGYVRADITNEIADGEFITAAPLDGEFNALEAAFNASTGHVHDGTTGNGAPITKIGPTQDIIVSGTTVLPKTTNTMDLGNGTFKFKDAVFDGVVTSDSFVGPLTGAVTGAVTGNASTATTLQTARTIAISGQVTGTATSFNGSANISISVDTLSASNLNAGTVPSDRIAGVYAGITGVGTVVAGNIGGAFGNINIGSNTFTGNGSGLTTLNATQLTSGTMPAARLAEHSADLLTSGTVTNARMPSAISVTSVTTTGNITGQLVHKTDGGYFRLGSYDIGVYGNGAARIWYNHNDQEISLLSDSGNATVVASAFDGSLNATQMTSGTLPVARLTGSYTGITGTGALNAGSITSGFGDINIGTDTFTGNGSGLTSLNATQLTTGTLPAARLGTTASDADWVRERYGDNTANEIGMISLLLGPGGGHSSGTNYSSSDLRTPAIKVDVNSNALSAHYGSAPSGTWKALTGGSSDPDERILGVFLKVS